MPTDPMSTYNEMLESWMKAQQDLLKAWSEKVQPKPADAGLSGPWADWQRSFFETWTSANREFLNALAKSVPGAQANPSTEWKRFYEDWEQSFSKYFQNITKFFPEGPGRDLFGHIMRGSDVYLRLQEVWNAFSGKLKDQSFRPDAFSKWADMSGYNDVLNRVFGLQSPLSPQNFQSHAAAALETWLPLSQEFGNAWLESTKQNMELLPKLATGDASAVATMFENLQKNFQKPMGDAMRAGMEDRERQRAQAMMEFAGQYASFLSKQAEFQQLIHRAGREALEKALAKASDQAKQGEALDFDKFFKIWVESNEDYYHQVFKSEEFAKLQGDLLDAALKARERYNQSLETMLSDVPVALKSELDEVYKMLHDLKRKVRDLEKQQKGSTGG